MPRRASLTVFVSFAAALVFVTGISTGAAQEGGLKAKEAEVASAQDRLMEIRTQTSAAQAAYNNTLYEMNQLNGKVSQATEDLDAAKKRLARAQDDLEERASQVYKSGNVAFVEVLVGVDDFSEFATRVDLWVRLLGEERAKVEAVERAKDDLAARKRDLEERRNQRVDAVDKAIAHKERAEKAERDAEVYLGSLNAELRDALQAKQDRQAAAALAAAEEFKTQKVKPAPAPAPDKPAPVPQKVKPAPIPEIRVTQVKQVPVGQPDLHDEQAAADRAAAAEAAAAEAERLAEKRAAERAAAREAAERAAEQAAERQAARKAAAKGARQEAREAEQAAAERAAERQAARKAADREAERAAERAAAERAAAQQAADEREAAELAAQRRAELRKERRLAREQAAAAAGEARVAEQAAASASASAAAAQEKTAGNKPPPETTGNKPPPETTGGASASASASAPADAAPVGGGGASGSGSSVIAEGQEYLGTPYVLGGAKRCVPHEMMDCSCFTMTVYSAFGIALPDSPGGQMGYGTPVSGAPKAGDLLFWSEDGSGHITHVGIAMGDGTAIHASTFTGDVTQGTPIDAIPGYVGARRLL
jgi:cell wall-associated NlpC family hydrolase